jgi:hypothetical protein
LTHRLPPNAAAVAKVTPEPLCHAMRAAKRKRFPDRDSSRIYLRRGLEALAPGAKLEHVVVRACGRRCDEAANTFYATEWMVTALLLTTLSAWNMSDSDVTPTRKSRLLPRT